MIADDEKTSDILIVAGEASGDLLGASFVQAFQKAQSGYSFWGIGGQFMNQAGVRLAYDIKDLGVTGFTEVLFKIRHILHVKADIVRFAKTKKPVAAILIDYPDFNLRLARQLKKNGIPVVYYVSPQMWAWRSGRVDTVRASVDKMMVLFPFEERWYRDRGVDATFVGHPIIDRIAMVDDRSECRQSLELAESDFLIAMLPGSRINEVNANLPVLLRSAVELDRINREKSSSKKHLRFVIPLADTISEKDLADIDIGIPDNVQVIRGSTLAVLKAADFAWVTSGTAALETALLQTPHIVVYRISPVTYHLAKVLVKTHFISIANIILDEMIIPELIQREFVPDRLVRETQNIIDCPERVETIRKRLADLQGKFGPRGASERAVVTFLETLKELRRNGVISK